MDEKYRDTCLKVLGCLIWADGKVTEQEEKKFAEFISIAGNSSWVDLIERHETEAVVARYQAYLKSLIDRLFV